MEDSSSSSSSSNSETTNDSTFQLFTAEFYKVRQESKVLWPEFTEAAEEMVVFANLLDSIQNRPFLDARLQEKISSGLANRMREFAEEINSTVLKFRNLFHGITRDHLELEEIFVCCSNASLPPPELAVAELNRLQRKLALISEMFTYCRDRVDIFRALQSSVVPLL